ncbi:MAG: sulfite exporter TauE/SafE family protein [Gemmatimonadota bacterium]
MIGAIIAGLSAGAIHVLAGPDHLAAVAPLAADRKKRPWTAGFLWGLGHAGGVVVVGLAALLLREVLPVDRLSDWSERLVGLVLIAIGVWGIRQATRQRVHVHEHQHDGHRHAHVHVHHRAANHEAPHAHGEAAAHLHVQTRAAFGVGILHGLAGSAHFLGILPALAFADNTSAVAYVAAFGVGTVAAMTVFAALIGWVAKRFSRSGARLYRGLLLTFGVAAIVVGLFWLVG